MVLRLLCGSFFFDLDTILKGFLGLVRYANLATSKSSAPKEIFKKPLHVCKKSLHQNLSKYGSSRCRERARENPALAAARATILRKIGPRASEEIIFEMGGLGQAG